MVARRARKGFRATELLLQQPRLLCCGQGCRRAALGQRCLGLVWAGGARVHDMRTCMPDLRGVTLVVGDVSFLHDVNGLNLLRTGMSSPLT